MALEAVPPVPQHPTWRFELDAAGDGVLCVRQRADARSVPFIPARFREACMQAAHDLPITGHMGRDVTLHRLHEATWWPGQGRHVRAFVQTCVACACRKRAVSSKGGARWCVLIRQRGHTPYPATWWGPCRRGTVARGGSLPSCAALRGGWRQYR